GPESNELTYADVGDLLFRDGDLRGNGRDVVNLGDQGPLGHQLASHLVQVPAGGRHDAGGGTDHRQQADLLFEIASLRLQPLNLGLGRLDILRARTPDQ